MVDESHIHDVTYKKVFSKPEVMHDFILGYLKEAIASDLDFSTLERYTEVNVSSFLEEGRDDQFWRIKAERTGWQYIFVINEFQSKDDHWMALRMLEYVAVFLGCLVFEKKIAPGDPVPFVLPVVLYNGKEAWKSAHSVGELRGDGNPPPRYQAHLEYVLVDVHQLVDELMKDQQNLATLFFQLERAQNLEQFLAALRAVTDRLEGSEYADLRRIIGEWIYHAFFRRKGMQGNEETIRQAGYDLLEVAKPMFAWDPEEWKKQYIQEGMMASQPEVWKAATEEAEKAKAKAVEEATKAAKKATEKAVEEATKAAEKEAAEKKKFITNMFKNNMTMEQVKAITNYSEDKIKEICAQ